MLSFLHRTTPTACSSNLPCPFKASLGLTFTSHSCPIIRRWSKLHQCRSCPKTLFPCRGSNMEWTDGTHQSQAASVARHTSLRHLAKIGRARQATLNIWLPKPSTVLTCSKQSPRGGYIWSKTHRYLRETRPAASCFRIKSPKMWPFRWSRITRRRHN